MPKANGDWWADKLASNRARDRAKDEQLTNLGWLPIHVWEDDDPGAAAERIASIVAQRRM